MENKIVCGTCDGYPEQTDIGCCYHCGNTGYINAEQKRWDRIEGLAMSLGHIHVMGLKKSRDQGAMNDDCEPWGFLAAENMMSEYDYTTARTMDEGGLILRGFEAFEEKAGTSLLDEIIELIQRGLDVPKPQVNPEPLPGLELDYDGEPLYGDTPTKEPNENWPKKVPKIDVSKLPPTKASASGDDEIPF